MSESTTTPMTDVADAVLATPGHVRVRGSYGNASRLAQVIGSSAFRTRHNTRVAGYTHDFSPMELVDAVTMPSTSGSPNRSRLEMVLNRRLAEADVLLLTFVEHQKDEQAHAALQEILAHNTMLRLRLKDGLKVVSIVSRSAGHDRLDIPTTLAL